MEPRTLNMNIATTSKPALSGPRAAILKRTDLRNVCLLLVGFASVLIAIPPVRSFATGDDWAYAQSAGRLLNFNYTLHDFTQPSALGHLVWGALLSALFGYNFTALSAASLLTSAICLVLFYLLLRQLKVAPTFAMLGVALLGFNPVYIYISYSFMTDVTFVAYVLAACLCYLRGFSGYGERWLWFGSLAAALAYLTRQHGALVAVAALIFMWWARKWTWKRAIAIGSVPGLVTIIYMVWERLQPPHLVSQVVNDAISSVLANPLGLVEDRLFRFAWTLPIMGLSLLPLLWPLRRRFAALPLFSLLLLFQIRSLLVYGSVLPQSSNVVDNTGIVMLSYGAAPVWPEAAWVALAVTGALSASLYLTMCGMNVWDWLRSRPWQSRSVQTDPALLVYLVGFLLGGITVLSPYYFDRYLLPLMPILMLPSLRKMSDPGRQQAAVDTHSSAPARRRQRLWTLDPGPRTLGISRWAPAIAIATFSLLAQRDYMEHASVRWQAAQQLVAQGVPLERIDAGYEWNAWQLFDKGLAYIRATQDYKYIIFPPSAILDPQYVVSDMPDPRYSVVSGLPYTSWLSGGQTRRVLVLKRR